jgi:hypothetical protein
MRRAGSYRPERDPWLTLAQRPVFHLAIQLDPTLRVRLETRPSAVIYLHLGAEHAAVDGFQYIVTLNSTKHQENCQTAQYSMSSFFPNVIRTMAMKAACSVHGSERRSATSTSGIEPSITE